MGNWQNSACSIVSRCCSLQDTFVPPEHRRFRRVHGLQLPLHPQQVVGWFVLVFIGSGTFSVSTPLLAPRLRLLFSVLIGSIFFVHVIVHLTVLLLDPAEPRLRSRSANVVVPEFDRSKHLHVIENGRCHLCNITTSDKRTKHCSICNKCVARFDHHCKWLNNCIGSRNYPVFLACVVSAIAASLAVIAVTFGELLLFNLDSSAARRSNATTMIDNTTVPSTVVTVPPGTGTLIVISAIGILSAIAAILLIHLCFFHGYIACLGLTTYEYVRNKREKSSLAIMDTHLMDMTASTTASCSTFCAKVDVPMRYHFCDTDATSIVDTQQNRDTEARKVQDRLDRGKRGVVIVDGDEVVGDGNVDPCNVQSETNTTVAVATRDRRNFHLCFTYETRPNGASIEVSSQTILSDDFSGRNHQFWSHNSRIPESPDLKSSTPSPVSCCFSMISTASTKRQQHDQQPRHGRSRKRRKDNDGVKDSTARSCGTIGRIRTFLRARLKKNTRQRSLNPELVGRVKRKYGVPTTKTKDDDKEQDRIEIGEERKAEDSTLSTNRFELLDKIESRTPDALVDDSPSPGDVEFFKDDTGDPHRAPAMALSPIAIPVSLSIAMSIPTVKTITPFKKNQAHLRVRQASFRKRPEFKIIPRIVQSTQLSPIPESEFSKPASPRSSPRSCRFTFPPLYK